MRAFEGIRILDFTQVLAGPFAVMQLALLGAEVIKIEQPGMGDQTRQLMNETDNPLMSAAFMTVNLNKQSMTLNLKDEAAAEIVRRLVADADVVVENFRTGTMKRRGLDYEALSAIKPDLIYCAITGYGQTGPKANEAAYDGAIQAASGMMSQTGHPATGPTRTGYMPVDMSTALNAAFAISAALHRKAKTGQGQFLDVSMMDTAVIMQAAQFSNYLNQGKLVGLKGNGSPTGQPTADTYPTRDGYIQITALQQHQVETLFGELGLSDMLAQPEYSSPNARLQHPEAIITAISKVLKTRSTGDWINRLKHTGIPVAEIKALADVAGDPQFEGRNAFVTLPSPYPEDGDVTVAQAGYVTNVDGPRTTSGPPLLGADTDRILKRIGYTGPDIDRLRAAGTI